MFDEYEPGARCWLPSKDEGWVGAEVVGKDASGDKLVLQLRLENGTETELDFTHSELESRKKQLPPLRNPPILEGTEDLTTLSYLNEPAVLHAIRTRYAQLNIYTFSGIVLIATNPFDKVDNLYTPEVIQTYSGRQRGELEPHLFSIAEDAYRCMIRDNRNQTIVVSGESGAGKTVSAKYIMRYFATVDDPDHPRKDTSRGTAGDLSEVEREILATNPIMEAFGNAKTTRNDNSSRFGKYLEIRFSDALEIIGARIRTYLLERSRIVFHQPAERNYHIFYQLLRGASPDLKHQLGLGSIADYHYLNQGDPNIAGVNDGADFEETCSALEVVGIDRNMQQSVFQVLAALLHLGNTAIKATRSTVIVQSDDPELSKACELLGISASDMSRWLMKKQLKMRNEKILSDLDEKSSIVVRDSMAKYIYSTLFDWLVDTVNGKLLPADSEKGSFIGVLDIYGFEHFQTNSFEQFCINYANEKLQQEFNQHVFKLEQEEYQKEEIDWTYIDFSDNQPCIDLIENKLGILGLLDEESRLPAGTDDGFAQKLYGSFDKGANAQYFKKPRFGQSGFVVRHYAMDVSYETEGFIEKNRDTVPDQIIDVLNATTNPFLKQVLDDAANKRAAAEAEAQAAIKAAPEGKPGKPGPVGKLGGASKTRKPTLGNIFKTSLIDLMKTINSTNVHYIRCIKPNDQKLPWTFEPPMVLSQLRACGVLETIRISSAGFPSRWSYEDFAERYEMLLNSAQRKSTDANAICSAIIKASIDDPDKYQMGKSKIFFRAGMLAYLEKLRSDRLAAAAVQIQKLVRTRYTRRKYEQAIASVRSLQDLSRGFMARKQAQAVRENAAATRLQAQYRGLKHQRGFNNAKQSVVDFQALVRGIFLRRHLYENAQRESAELIQSAIRGHLARSQYRSDVKLVTLLQSMVRRKGARRELVKLREERHSVKHFEQAQYRLENKVIQLQNSVSQFKVDNQALTENLAKLQAEHDELTSKYHGALAHHEKEIGGHTERYTQASGELSQLRADHGNAVRSLEDSKTSVSSLEAQLAERDAQIVSLTEKLTASEKELESTKAAANTRQVMMSGGGGGPNPLGLQQDAFVDNEERAPQLYAERVGEDAVINNEIERMLNEIPGAQEELLSKLIRNLAVPMPKANETLHQRDVLFPANMVNMMISEMWRLGYVNESEKLIGSILKMIQETVQKFTGEKIIPVGAFWMSNVHEIYSFLCLAEVNILQNPGLRDVLSAVELSQYERLMSLAKRDAEAVTFNIYHIWMKEIKKLLDKMIVMAVVDEQSIPGFHVEEQTRFLAKMFQSGPVWKMNDLLLLLTKVYTAMKAFHLEERYIRQPILELLNMVGAKAFNDMIMRKNFLSWKRAVQINYNVTRMEEWCKGHGMPEGGLPLDRLMQSCKLLQLKKNLSTDVSIIYDICWALTPAQIQRLIANYHISDYEEPIPQNVRDLVAQRVKEDKHSSTQLLLDVRPPSDSGPFEMAAPRVLQKIEPYIPADIDVPNLRQLTELTSKATREQPEPINGEADTDIMEDSFNGNGPQELIDSGPAEGRE